MPGAGQPDTNMGREVTYFKLGDESIAPNGELRTMEITPEFISEYPIRAIYTGPRNDRLRRSYSWDTLNFAFYFPNRQGQIQVESQLYPLRATCFDCREVRFNSFLRADVENYSSLGP